MQTSSVGAPNKVKRNGRAGSALVIVLVVVGVVIALGAVGLVVYSQVITPRLLEQAERAKRVSAKVRIKSFMTGIISYKLDSGNYPTTAQGLQALRVRPASEPHWGGPYLSEDVQLDPWQHAYIYKYPGQHGDEPDIVSLGADGQPGGDGNNADIGSWDDN